MIIYLEEGLKGESVAATSLSRQRDTVAIAVGMSSNFTPLAFITTRTGFGSFSVMGGAELAKRLSAPQPDCTLFNIAHEVLLKALTPESFGKLLQDQYDQGQREAKDELFGTFPDLLETCRRLQDILGGL